MKSLKYLLMGLTIKLALLFNISIANAQNFDLFTPSGNLNTESVLNKSSNHSANLGQKIITAIATIKPLLLTLLL